MRKTGSIPWNRRRVLRLCVVAFAGLILAWPTCLLISYVVFHTSAHAETILNGVGREVELTYFDWSARPVQGTLTHAGFQWEVGKTWVLYMDIGVRYRSGSGGGSIKTILSPFELDRVKFIDIRAHNQGGDQMSVANTEGVARFVGTWGDKNDIIYIISSDPDGVVQISTPPNDIWKVEIVNILLYDDRLFFDQLFTVS